MSPMHIWVEVDKGQLATNSPQEAMDFLLEHQDSKIQRVSIEANSEAIIVLAGIAEIKRRNAAPIAVGHTALSTSHLPRGERTDGTYRNRK